MPRPLGSHSKALKTGNADGLLYVNDNSLCLVDFNLPPLGHEHNNSVINDKIK